MGNIYSVYLLDLLESSWYKNVSTVFLPRCMECRRGLAVRILSVCPSVKRVDCDKTEERYV